MKFQTQNSFTVIELLVAIAIIGLLASIVLVALDLPGKRRAAELVKSLQFSQSIQNALGAEAVGIWSFETIEGNKTPDRSGYGNDGTIYGAVQAQGVEVPGGGTGGMALSFDGIDNYVDCGTDSTLDITDGLTVGAWIKQISRNNWRTILSKGQSPVFSVHNYILSIELNGSIRLKGTFGALDSGSGFLELNTWHYVVGVADGTNLKIYVDGKQIALGGQSSLPTATPDKKCLIGAYSLTDSDKFHGLIDDVRIYSQALSAAQIQKLYAEGLERHKNLAIK